MSDQPYVSAVSGDRRTALVVALYEDRRTKGADWNVPDVMAVIDRQLDGRAVSGGAES